MNFFRLGVIVGLMAALAAACTVSAGATGSCPCTVGNSGLSVTLGCGESTCADINGTATGYVCDSDGLKTDPSVCDNAPNADAATPFDGSQGHDGSLPRDAGAPFDAAPADGGKPDGFAFDAAGQNGCVALSDGGTCSSPSECDCLDPGGCSFACGDAPGDAGLTVGCIGGSTCDVSCATGCSVDCAQSQACAVHVGAGSEVICLQSQDCTGTVGANGMVDCSQASTCVVSVGSGTSVDCNQAGTCTVDCQGACQVNCNAAEACALQCGGASGSCALTCGVGATVTTCPDGKTQVCGATPCPVGPNG